MSAPGPPEQLFNAFSARHRDLTGPSHDSTALRALRDLPASSRYDALLDLVPGARHPAQAAEVIAETCPRCATALGLHPDRSALTRQDHAGRARRAAVLLLHSLQGNEEGVVALAAEMAADDPTLAGPLLALLRTATSVIALLERDEQQPRSGPLLRELAAVTSAMEAGLQ